MNIARHPKLIITRRDQPSIERPDTNEEGEREMERTRNLIRLRV